MALTNAGAIALASLAVADGSYPAFNYANSYLAVGTDGTAFSAAQTALVAQNGSRKPMVDASYPSRSNGAVTFRSLWGTSDGIGAWLEWGTFNASTSGTMLNRKAENLGTKGGTQSWQLTVTLTFAAA